LREGQSATVMPSIVVNAALLTCIARRAHGAEQVTRSTDAIASLPGSAEEIVVVHAAL
jgi:hypothetical protein